MGRVADPVPQARPGADIDSPSGRSSSTAPRARLHPSRGRLLDPGHRRHYHSYDASRRSSVSVREPGEPGTGPVLQPSPGRPYLEVEAVRGALCQVRPRRTVATRVLMCPPPGAEQADRPERAFSWVGPTHNPSHAQVLQRTGSPTGGAGSLRLSQGRGQADMTGHGLKGHQLGQEPSPADRASVITRSAGMQVASGAGDRLVLDDFDLRTGAGTAGWLRARPLCRGTPSGRRADLPQVTQQAHGGEHLAPGVAPRRDGERETEDSRFVFPRETGSSSISQEGPGSLPASRCSSARFGSSARSPMSGAAVRPSCSSLLQRHRALLAHGASLECSHFGPPAGSRPDDQLDSRKRGLRRGEQWTMTDSDRQLQRLHQLYLLRYQRDPLLVREARPSLPAACGRRSCLRIDAPEQRAEGRRQAPVKPGRLNRGRHAFFVGLPLSVFLRHGRGWNTGWASNCHDYRVSGWQIGWGLGLRQDCSGRSSPGRR